MGIVKTGLLLGFGASALQKVQSKQTGTAATISGDALTGVGNVAKFLPVTGTVQGASLTLKAVKGGGLMAKKKTRRRKKRR